MAWNSRSALRAEKIDGVEVDIISLEDLKINKPASARYQDLDDLDHLP